MRGLTILVLLVILLPTTQPGPSSSIAGESASVLIQDEAFTDAPGLLMSEVCPGRPVDYILISNTGPDTSIQGLVIGDGEGNVTVLTNVTLLSGGTMAVTSDGTAFNNIYPGTRYLQKGTPDLSWGGRFALADGGDDVYLRSSEGLLLDVVVYGTSTFSGEGWSGAAVGPVPKAHAVVRTGGDHDTASDWSVEPPGRSHFPSGSIEALVEPFSCPEDAAGRIARELSLASRTVNCSIYELTDPGTVAALAACSGRGIDVKVLLEGQPVGGLSDDSLAAISALQAAGVDVRELRSSDSYKRYDYLHAKYMIVDGFRTMVMSENWGKGLSANRGWAVCMEGWEISRYYENVFDHDFAGKLDVTTPNIAVPALEPAGLAEWDLDGLVRFRCQVTPLVSPDNSVMGLRELITGARRTILVEQLSVTKDWLSAPSLITDLVDAAVRGVQVRLLLDSSWGGGDNGEVASRLNAMAAADGLDLEARIISDHHGLSVMHNKGLIVDDHVVISSINWGDSALHDNREVGVVLASSKAASFFSELFWSDWSVDPVPPEAVLPWLSMEILEGDAIYLDGTLSRDNAGLLGFEWDVGGDGTIENRSSGWTARLPEGNHTIVLTVRDIGNNTAMAVCRVTVLPRSEGVGGGMPILLILPAAVPLSIVLWKKIIARKRY